ITALPVEVIALTQISEIRKISGGMVTTTSRSGRLAYRPARMQPARKLTPVRTGRCSHPAGSVPGKNSENIARPAPRAVSRAGAAPPARAAPAGPVPAAGAAPPALPRPPAGALPPGGAA